MKREREKSEKISRVKYKAYVIYVFQGNLKVGYGINTGFLIFFSKWKEW